MAFSYLSPQGRIWQANGLNYLLYPQDLSTLEGMCTLKSQDFNLLPKKRFMEKPLSQGEEPQSRQPASGGVYSRSADAARAERSRVQAPTAANAEQSGTGQNSASKSSGRKGSPPETWPQPWQRQLARTQKALFAWTYMDLGLDLLNGSKERKEDISEPEQAGRKMRSQCMRKLFSDLSHPLGTHTFWPIALPDNGSKTYLPNIDCFWSGLDKLGCRGVIFMGKKAASAAMGTDDLKPLSQLFKFGKLVWILWEPDEIARNPKVYSAVLPFLRRSLGQFIRI